MSNTFLCIYTVLFKKIQFIIQNHFYFKHFSLVLFDPYIGPYQVLPHRAKVDLGAMAFPNAPASLQPYHQIFSVISWIFLKGSYPSGEMQSVYFKFSVNWTIQQMDILCYKFLFSRIICGLPTL